MDIGDVAKQTGLKPSTLRYYEQVGLIKSEGRNGLRRTYNQRVVRQLILINLWRKAHFSIAEIRAMTSVSGKTDRQMLLQKSEELEGQIKELQAISDSLKRIAACPERDFFDCDSFVNYLKAKHLITS